MVYLYTGAINAGKTSRMLADYRLLSDNMRGDGIISRKVMLNDTVTGYDFFRLSNGERVPGLRLHNDLCGQLNSDEMMKSNDVKWQTGKFDFLSSGFDFVSHTITSLITAKINSIWLDEIGPLELQGNGFCELAVQILKNTDTVMLGCRESILEQVIKSFRIQSYKVITVQSADIPLK